MGTRTIIESTEPAGPAGPAGRQGASGRAGGRRAHVVAVGVLTAFMAALYAIFGLVRYHTFRLLSYDLVIFDQAVRSYAHMRPGISILKGVHNGFGPDFPVLGDHWSPLLASLAPLYWIYSNPQTLLVAQAILFALAIPPLWIFTRRAFGGGDRATIAAYLISAAYALSWPIAEATKVGFHEVAFAPVLTAVALERIQAGRLRSALIALAALLLVKEDMGLLVAGIGLYLAVGRPRVLDRQMLVGLALIAVGIADTWLASQALIPAFGGRADYYWAYTALGPNAPQAAWHLIAHPASSLQLLVTPRVKLDTVLWLFGAFCFLSLRSPIALAAAPLLLERMLANLFPNWWVTSFQYNAYLVVILLCAAVDGAARLDRSAWASRYKGMVAIACAAAMCVVALFLVPRFALGAALSPSFDHLNGRMKGAAAAAAAVPSGVTVEAADRIGPHLSARDTVLLWDQQGPRWAPWVVADVAHRVFTFANLSVQIQRVALLERSGYSVVFARHGYIVLHRAGPRPGTRAFQAAAG